MEDSVHESCISSKKGGFLLTVTLSVVIGVCLVYATFTRDYPVSADGLVEVRATAVGRTVIVSGVILSSGSRISRTTLATEGHHYMIRIYTIPIQDTDDARRVTGRFTVTLPLQSNMRITVGDGQRLKTIGRLCGWPVRIPRLRLDRLAERTVWPER